MNTTIDENGHFTLGDVTAGTYNILVKVEGYLAKLSAGVVVSLGQNSLNTGAIIAGDVNGSNSINISDISTISASFGSISTDSDYNYLAVIIIIWPILIVMELLMLSIYLY